MLIKQLKSGKTIIERIQAARILQEKKYSDDDVIPTTLQKQVLEDSFYGVSVEAANSLGSYASAKDEGVKTKVYQSLNTLFNKDNEGKSIFSTLHPQIRQALVVALGGFEREDSFDVLQPLLTEQSYFVEQQAAIAIGKSSKKLPQEQKKENY